MMNDVLVLTASLVAGGGLSLLMFGGLWWTLRRLPQVRHPSLFALASFWGRVGVTVGGFYLITAGDWRRGVVALLGFLLVRTLLVRWLGPARAAVAEGA